MAVSRTRRKKPLKAKAIPPSASLRPRANPKRKAFLRRTELLPGLPSLARPTAAHVAAAAALSILIAGIYGTIAWGMFIRGDFQAHITFARILYDTGHPPVPHFLFHALTVVLFAAHMAPSLVFAGRVVLVGCYGLIALVMYSMLWIVFQNSRIGRPLVLFLAALATLLAEPLTFAGDYTIGFFWPEPYQIPTSTVLKPFALASFAFTAWYLVRRCRIDMRMMSLFAFATVAGSLSKPSLTICLLPASAMLLIYRFVRRLPVSIAGLLAGLYLPAAAVLAWQFYESYSGYGSKSAYHDSVMWAPFKFMHHWATGLLSKFFLSITFPIVITVLYWKKARRDTMLQLAWLCFLFGALYSYALAEKVNWAAGNFAWSGYITAFTLFVASTVFWLRQIASATSRGWVWGGALTGGGAIALHVLAGVRFDWLYLRHLWV